MRQYKIVILTLILFACNSEKDINEKIAGNTEKYWDVWWSGSFEEKILNPDPSAVYCYYFDRTGKYRIYSYRNGRRVLYDGGDIEIPEVWNYLSDSTIMIATANYKIEKLTRDIFIYSSQHFGRKMLVKSKNQSTALDTIIIGVQ